MIKKNLKILTLLVIGITSIFVGVNIVNAAPSSGKMTYDYEGYVLMPDTLKIGENHIVLTERSTSIGVTEDNSEIYYKLTELTKEKYDEIKKVQDAIDAKRQAGTLEGGDEDVTKFEKLVADGEYWCYDDYEEKPITLETFCGKKYYILTVDVKNPSIKVFGAVTYEYMSGRVYEVTGDPDVCPVCKEYGGKYYDNTGKVVDKGTYEKACPTPTTPNPKCEVKNGKYYDKDGKAVDEPTYKKSCNPSCGVRDDKYYDKDGNEIEEEDYRKVCLPKCMIKDGKYYDDKGTIVDKDAYEKACLPDNPHTGRTNPYIISTVIALGAIAIILVSKKKKFM